MTLDTATIQAALPGRPVHFNAQVTSTNTLAHDWIMAGGAAGAVFIADEQTGGRGRLGRGWYAPPGTALMLSVVLPPKPDWVSWTAALGAVAVGELLESYEIAGVGIKWPNDVQIDRRKVAGILPEAVWQTDRLGGIILGMGINLRIDFSSTELADKAISVETVLGRPVDRLDALVRLLRRVDHWLAQPGPTGLAAAWQRRLNMIGEPVTLAQGDSVVTGIADGVDARGALLIRRVDGSVYRAVAGDIAVGV